MAVRPMAAAVLRLWRGGPGACGRAAGTHSTVDSACPLSAGVGSEPGLSLAIWGVPGPGCPH